MEPEETLKKQSKPEKEQGWEYTLPDFQLLQSCGTQNHMGLVQKQTLRPANSTESPEINPHHF